MKFIALLILCIIAGIVIAEGLRSCAPEVKAEIEHRTARLET